MLPYNKKYFIVKAKNIFQIKYDKVNNIPFGFELHNLGTACEIWEKDMHIETPNHTFQGVHRFQYDGEED